MNRVIMCIIILIFGTCFVSALSCGDTITSDTLLNASLSSCVGKGLVIGADNVVLDCAGYNIIGKGIAIGILVNSRSNITIKNCNISNFNNNLYLVDVNNSVLINNDISNAIHYGVQFNRADNAVIIDNDIHGCALHGLIFKEGPNPSRNILIQDNRIYENIYYQLHMNGATLSNANYTIYNNVIRDAGHPVAGIGILTYYTSGVNISNNEINNVVRGIYVQSSTPYFSENLVISGNIIINNIDSGIYMESPSNGTLIYNNKFENNAINAYSEALLVSWNKVKDCSRLNIIGGSCIGGNYYDDYGGSDIDDDGIGETDYNIGGNNVDYLPLTNQRIYRPLVDLYLPIDDTSLLTSYVNFTYSVVDNDSDVDTCTLWLNKGVVWELNSTDSSITEGIYQTFNLTMEDSTVSWLVECNDTDNNKGNSSVFDLTVSIPPLVEEIVYSSPSSRVQSTSNEMKDETVSVDVEETLKESPAKSNSKEILPEDGFVKEEIKKDEPLMSKFISFLSNYAGILILFLF